MVIASFAGALSIAAGLIINFEGVHNRAYYDPPGIATICYGHTAGVKITDVANDQKCVALLNEDVKKTEATINRLVKVPMPETRKAALVDFVYNVGEPKFSHSTLLKKLNTGDTVGACNELTRWVYSGGKKLPGLVKRREAEKELCLRK